MPKTAALFSSLRYPDVVLPLCFLYFEDLLDIIEASCAAGNTTQQLRQLTCALWRINQHLVSSRPNREQHMESQPKHLLSAFSCPRIELSPLHMVLEELRPQLNAENSSMWKGFARGKLIKITRHMNKMCLSPPYPCILYRKTHLVGCGPPRDKDGEMWKIWNKPILWCMVVNVQCAAFTWSDRIMTELGIRKYLFSI